MVIPANVLSKILDNAKTLIAECSAFQTWVSAVDAAAAKANIHLCSYEDPAQNPAETDAAYYTRRAGFRPFAVIGAMDSFLAEKDTAIQNYWYPEGTFGVIFEGCADIADSEADAIIKFTNSVGGILEEIQAAAGENGLLNIYRMQMRNGPAIMAPEAVTEGELRMIQIEMEFAYR